MTSEQVFWSESHLRRGFSAEVFDQYVGLVDQLVQEIEPFRLRQIERETALAAVRAQIVGRELRAEEWRSPGASVVARAGPFELDDLAHQIGKKLAQNGPARTREASRTLRPERGEAMPTFYTSFATCPVRGLAGSQCRSQRRDFVFGTLSFTRFIQSTLLRGLSSLLRGLSSLLRGLSSLLRGLSSLLRDLTGLFGGPGGLRPRRNALPRLRVDQAQKSSVGLEDQAELPAQEATLFQLHRTVFAPYQPIALETRLQIVAQEIEEKVLRNLEYIPVKRKLGLRVLFTRRFRRQFDHDVRAPTLFPQKIIIPRMLRHAEDNQDIRRHVLALFPCS